MIRKLLIIALLIDVLWAAVNVGSEFILLPIPNSFLVSSRLAWNYMHFPASEILLGILSPRPLVDIGDISLGLIGALAALSYLLCLGQMMGFIWICCFLVGLQRRKVPL